jgi:hypothetical protein
MAVRIFDWAFFGFMKIRALITLTVLLAMVVFCYAPVAGQLSPGDLHKSHEFLEGMDNCQKCHNTDGASLAENCLACHAPIKTQRLSGSGLHGNPDYGDCQLCHVEHQGRDYELVYFEGGMEAFDHDRTGYLSCRKCHNPEHIVDRDRFTDANVNLQRTFLGLEQRCLSCHFDEHRGQVARDCESCHTFESWRPAPGFDHAETEFPLTGKHQSVACEKCHIAVVDAETPRHPEYRRFTSINHTACTDCHTDPHTGQLGADCANCHSTAGWLQVAAKDFDHSKTRYPLEGRHKTVSCAACHGNRSAKKKLNFANCTDCHRDFHRGAFADRTSGGTCEECHTVHTFKPSTFTIAAHSQTSFPLRGAHLATPCIACHETTAGNEPKYQFVFASKACVKCHADPHGGQVNKYMKGSGCESCHAVESWENVQFDHGTTGFVLVGKHSSVICKACHVQKRADDLNFTGTPEKCGVCHNDVHFGQFAQESDAGGKADCSRCHGSENWKPGKFDHTRDARFILDGAHQRVPCGGCHPATVVDKREFVRYKPIPGRCIDCHRRGGINEESKS